MRKQTNKITSYFHCKYCHQSSPGGLWHSAWCNRSIVKTKPQTTQDKKWTRISLSTNDPDKVIEAINSTGVLISDYATSEPQTTKNNSTAEIARLFHDTYERLAPEYGYKTREDTKVFDPTSQNGRLMIAVCNEVLAQALHQERLRLIGEIEREVLITPKGKATVLIVGQEKDGKLINKHEVQADRLFMEALYEKQCKKLAEYKV